MNKVLIITDEHNDLERLILQACPGSVSVAVKDCDALLFDRFGAAAVLGGTLETPLTLRADLRIRLEAMREEKKPVFCEFIGSIDYHVPNSWDKLVHSRLLCVNESLGLETGDLLDPHYNDCQRYYLSPDNVVLLTCHPYITAHAHVEPTDELMKKGRPALFKLDGSTLISAVRLCQFNAARFAPTSHWQSVIKYIVSFLAGQNTEPDFPEPLCRFEDIGEVSSPDDISDTIRAGLDWFKAADILIDFGRHGVREGLSHNIRASDGTQLRANIVRTDCSGETGGAFMLDWLLTGSEDSRRIFENLEDYCFNYMQIKSGLHRGMLRWTEDSWGACYQDDVARAILPTLLLKNFTDKPDRHFDDALLAVEYLLKTTGTNGLRVSRTDLPGLTAERMAELHAADNGTTRAHHNGYYAAVLLLCYRVTRRQELFDTALNGLTAIMNLYPDNEREQSETEEICRLILPLAILYEITKSPEHLAWLTRVTDDLSRLEHPCGGYREWDTGYKANRSRREDSECSLLTHNGDPVADLLYSVNWLPLGFAMAYYATGDEAFRARWNRIARFMALCQTKSENRLTNGSWARAFDLDRREIYGVPHDIGWSPCSVESGWTVGEILMGLQFMRYIDRQCKIK